MKVTADQLHSMGKTTRDRFVVSFLKEEYDGKKNFIDFYLMPKGVYTHKEYPTCTSCKGKFVPINKGETICFKCSFAK